VRESDTVARLGGDEFVVFLPEIDKDKAAFMVAEKILASFGSEFLVEDRVIRSSTSIGIAVFPEDGRDGRSLLRNADEAMYRAKEGGRNRVEVARGARCVEEDPGQGSGPDRRTDSL
jgi:diguanylate cyclase (GGDEF)-like protein